MPLFVNNFFQERQLQRIAIYFSRDCRTGITDPLTELITRLLTVPLAISFTTHGLFLFNLQFLYPYAEFDENQRKFANRIFMALRNPDDFAGLPRFEYHIAQQMGGGGIIQIKLKIKLEQILVLTALVKGVLTGKEHKHKIEYRKHALSVQLQRIMVKVNLHRVVTMQINDLIGFICSAESVKHTDQLQSASDSKDSLI